MAVFSDGLEQEHAFFVSLRGCILASFIFIMPNRRMEYRHTSVNRTSPLRELQTIVFLDVPSGSKMNERSGDDTSIAP